MKGWILMERNKPVITSNNSIEMFKTREDLWDYYGMYGVALGDLNTIKRVELMFK